MGWYGGQDGAIRSRWYDQSRDSLRRFHGSIGKNAQLTSFYDNVVNNEIKEIKMLVRNPMSQDELIKAILEAAPDEGESGNGGWAVAIAASDTLIDLTLLNDVADRITGLFLYGCHALDRTKMETFFSNLVNLESLTLDSCYLQRDGGVWMKNVFSEGMLPKLKFLETDEANDDVIAEMGTSPDLATIVFSYPSQSITNDGIERLVDAGGGKELMNISAGVLAKHLSKTLTKKYVAATLPKLVSLPQYQAHQKLTHMAMGKKKRSKQEMLIEKYKDQDSKPFAVVPPERMTFTQLEDALKRRGVTGVRGKKRTEELRAMFLDGTVAWSYDQELAFQNRDKLKHLQEELQRLKWKAASADGEITKLSTGKLGQNKGKLYPLLGAFEIDYAIRTTNVYIPRDVSKRRDDRAQLLHNSGYQGGGTIEQQLVHYRKVSAERHAVVAEKESEIQSLRREMALKDVGRATTNSGANTNTTITVTVIKPSNETKLGLGIGNSNSGIVVNSIAKWSLFANSELKVGCRIISINGQRYASFKEGVALITGAAEGRLVIVAEMRSPSLVPPREMALKNVGGATTNSGAKRGFQLMS